MTSAAPHHLKRLREKAEGGRDPVAWTEYVAALREAGQKGRARKVARAAPLPKERRAGLAKLADGRTEPGTLPPAVVGQLGAAFKSGDFARLRTMAANVLRFFPDAPEVLNLLGIAALTEDDLIEAEIRLRRALGADPENPDYLSNLALTLLRQGRAVEAIDMLRPIAEALPPTSAARINLASAFWRAGRHQEALETAEAVLDHAPEDTDALAVFFGAALALDRRELAEARFEGLPETTRKRLLDVELELIDLTDGRAAALERLSQAGEPGEELRGRLAFKLSAWGEFDSAAKLLREGLAAGQGGVAAWRKLGLISTWQAGDPLIAKLEAEAARSDQPPGRRAALLLSLAKARADTGDSDGAFAATLEGKRIWAEAVEYDPEAEWAGMRERLDDWTIERVADLTAEGPSGWHPIFIIGLPRSGSTLVEAILSRHPQVRSLGENPFAYSLAARSASTRESIAKMREALRGQFEPKIAGERVTDKLLGNFKTIGPLMAAFPSAVFLVMDRDFRATGLSILENPLAPADHPYSLTPERIARHTVNFARMVDAWEARWPERVRRISYEALVSDPDAEVPALLEAAGLDWDEAVLDLDRTSRRIDTLSVAQARKPISRASVARWRRHEAGLAPMIDVLENAGLISHREA